MASRTTPTECVLVMAIGSGQQARLADPLEAGQLAVAVESVGAGVDGLRRRDRPPRGTTTVTPVRTGPCPVTSGPGSPAMSVVWPTRTPATSVMAL